MPCSAKPGSALGELARPSDSRAYMYQSPSLWSAVEVISRIPEDRLPAVRVHGFASNTSVGTGPTTCESCHEAVVALLQLFNATGGRQAIDAANRISCDCRRDWQAEMQAKPQTSLDERMAAFVDALESVAVEEVKQR